MAGLWYRTGYVAVTQSSKNITGTGTSWLTALNRPSKGNVFYGPDGKAYEIDYISSETELYLVDAYAGAAATGQSYKIDVRGGTVPELSRQLSEHYAYMQGIIDSLQSIVSGSGDVTLTAPDGQQVTVPALSSMLSKSGNLYGLGNVASARRNLGISAFADTLLDDTDAAGMRATLGAVNRAGDTISSLEVGYDSTFGYELSWYIGYVSDTKPGLVLLARKYVGDVCSPFGFDGKIYVIRGNTTSSNIYGTADVSVKTAHTATKILSRYRTDHLLGSYLCEVTHNGVVYIALYLPPTSTRYINVCGRYWGEKPTVIMDASSYAITNLNISDAFYHVSNKPTASDVGALATSEKEVGTFTPTAKGETTGGTFTPSGIRSGRYMRIGNRCFFSIHMSGRISGATGAFGIGGLPFAIRNASPPDSGFSVLSLFHSRLTLAATLTNINYVAAANPSAQTISIYLNTFGVPFSTSDVSRQPAGDTFEVIVSGSYEIA